MRTFYIFRIKDEYATLTKNTPYQLFRMLNYIYNLDTKELNQGVEMFNKIADNFNVKEMDIDFFQKYKEDYFYMKYKNIHQINNAYRREESKLILRRKFLLLKSTIIRPSFLESLSNYKNLFFCDFENKDYFWLEKLPA